MCHDSNAIKDEIRTLHGLELILSSCVIDEHNPYMKEHAILCLKFLLQDNAMNQEFVAQLEAKQVIDGSALSDAGYEITIADGNVKLKHKPRE
ncbi:hypothetical protein METBIDRAFT_35102 [Metschnikowia bicuspidata var. bicuspidata NRRL YB-4993]|uniref:Ataxin-10 homolog n=1 Tax=Metschnikowia bicuspidata var. bicuspidata NRRL YB-4993 TaxID=869754 RepID=A0A1A0HJC2_9ASCO|nr:hypothetical protein METBIDRAFT_35102 [Metschnikowia bicuspidata var. bicuspidata NRRL YB-4993]OBA23938.1 hypothetical protein METBIDRAFT_35102 [Metschnikowia bicuspidata var. bicuspidata NRRL YB-4993]